MASDLVPSNWFNDTPVLAKLDPQTAIAKLREVGEETHAELSTWGPPGPGSRPATFSSWKGFFSSGPKAYQHAAHAFGYIASGGLHDRFTIIEPVGKIRPDGTLKNSRLTITLDGLRVAEYPGGGDHRILFDFYARNEIKEQTEDLHYNATYRVREGERAGLLGYPIFVGLNVGGQGLGLKCFTVNVKNDADEAFLGLLESDLFRSGLKLVNTCQPAIAPLSGLAIALTKSIASRHRNVPVQDFFLGLDFTNVQTRGRLAEGSYVAIQVPEASRLIWDWSRWVFDADTGQIVSTQDSEQLIPFNYIILGISRYGE